MRRVLFSLPLLFACTPAWAQDFKMEPGPLSPEESLKTIKARPGFKVELMVSEPLVKSPIAFAWGPDGKFWVVEMGDYPLGLDGKGKPGGNIKYLEKSKLDGPYDKMTLFMDGLGFPTGVFPYKNGVLVTCAPDIFYAEVGKDGKATKKEILFTGFKEGNQQHRVNGLTWGIDNWIYGANGDSGGVIKSLKTGKTVDIRGRDFRLKPDTGEFEPVSGQSQFGRCRDDWGNWFGNNNSNPMFHYVLDDHYLKRNPHVLYPDPRVPVIPGAIRVYPISKPLPRFNTPTALNHFTSACSTIIYRDTLFGKEFEGNVFVSEPVHNLVHRQIVKPKGVTFTAERAADEKESEFLASSDNWFRPAMIQVGPDGALWIADMYRYVIEHPEWIPKDWQKKLDLRAGQDKGRIYRVYPDDKKPRAIARLDGMKLQELDRSLSHPNGWVRDTAHQLLLSHVHAMKRQDLEKFADARLQAQGHKGYNTPQGKLHALYAYDRLHRDYPGLIPVSADDAHAALRKHYMLPDTDDAILSQIAIDVLAKDHDSHVRQQLAYNLGRHQPFSPYYAAALARLLLQHADDRYVLAAALSSVSDKNWPSVFAEVLKQDSISPQLLAPMLRLAKAYGKPLEASQLFVRQLNTPGKPDETRMAFVVEMLDVMEKNELSVRKLLESAGEKNTANAVAQLRKIHADAVKIVQNPNSPNSTRLTAIRLLGTGLGDDRDDHKLLLTFLTPQTRDDVQAAVITQLARNFDPRVPGLLLSRWKSYSPTLRGQVLDALLARPLWTKQTLDAIKQKQVPAQEIDAVRRQRLLLHKDAEIRNAAKVVFESASSTDRGKLVDAYWLQMPAKVDAQNGAKLFVKSCATCHKLGDVGQNVGPDFAAIGDRSPQGLLTAILDPNRALEARYINYVAETKKGLVITGILTSETSTSITLTGADGKQHQLLRNELDSLESTGKSLMPEGLEKDLSPQDMADLIAHLRGSLPGPKRKQFPGNEPKTLTPGKDGRLHLLPGNGAIYGSSIVIEKQYGNLWSKPDDHVIWTVELTKETTFSVWLDYAVAPEQAGNTLAIQCGSEKLMHTVKSTGSWDAYQLQSIGALRLPAGRSEIVVRAEGPIRGALLDLKGIELRPR